MYMSLFDYKDLILYKAWADLCSEARKYYISYAWWIVEPILEMLIFYLVFGVLLSRGGPNFIQFLLIGLVAWKWFGTTVQHCGNSILAAKGLIRQTALPKIIFPTVLILTDTFKAFIVTILIGLFLFYSDFSPNDTYLSLPLLFLVQLLLIIATGYTLAAIVPFFPDLSILVSLVLRMVYFLSGIFYDPQNISEKNRSLFFLNPMARIIDGYRGVLLHERWPDIFPLIMIGIISIIVIFIAASIIRRNDKLYPRVVTQ